MERHALGHQETPAGLIVPAHTQKVTHSYLLRYPAHEPRTADPFYKDFAAYRRRTVKTAQCSIGLHRNDFTECAGGLELHHSHIEFATMNSIDMAWLERDYPGVSDPNQVGAWVESAKNLMWLCERHHRGDDGVHLLTASDWEAIKYVKGLVQQ